MWINRNLRRYDLQWQTGRDPDRAIEMWLDGKDTHEIATALGVHESLIYNYLSACRETKLLETYKNIRQKETEHSGTYSIQGDVNNADAALVSETD